MSKFGKIFKRKSKADVLQFVESHYCAVINEKCMWFNSKDAMLKGIEEYGKLNSIFSLNMFRYDMFNLMK